MMATIENPKYTIDDLNNLELKVKDNKAEVQDYEYIDNYLSFLGVPNFILSKLKERGIDTYSDFVNERNMNTHKSISLLVGIVLGVISTLKKHVSGKI